MFGISIIMLDKEKTFPNPDVITAPMVCTEHLLVLMQGTALDLILLNIVGGSQRTRLIQRV